MAATLLRRSVATAAIAAGAMVAAPLAVSVLAPTTAFAASAPAMDETKSVPMQGGAIWSGGEDITAVFDQQITGNSGTNGSKTCSDTSGANQCAFVLYEINADGSRGLRLPGNTTFAKSGNPVTGVQDTVDFNPDFSLINGATYEAVVQVFGVKSDGSKDPSLVTNLDYKLYVSNAAPSQLSAPAFATTGNNTAFPLSGYAPPGMTVNVEVISPDDRTHQSDAMASGVVPPCSAISCPWTVKIDISGPNYQSPTGDPIPDVDWTAYVQDASGTPSAQSAPTTDAAAQKPPATFTIDYSPPAMPTNVSIKITNDPVAHTSSVTVSAQDSDSSTKSYLVTITDGSGNTLNPTFPAQGTNLPSTTIDVSGLNDGPLHVVVQAMDAVGNVSSECDNVPPPAQTCTSADPVKNAGLVPSMTTSTITSGGADTSFTNAQSQAVQSPTKITVGFTQPIKASYTSCCGGRPPAAPKTQNSSLCIATPNGNCIASGGTPTVASDNLSISFPISTTVPDGTYEIQVLTYSKDNCPDQTPETTAANGGTPTACEQYGPDFVRIPGTGTPATPFKFTVDSTPPTVSIAAVTNPVTPSNETSVGAFGGVSTNVATVQVLYTSAGKSPTKLLVNGTVKQPSDPSATTTTWSAGPSDLSSFPDGPITVKVTAKKASGLAGTATKTIQMKAHISTLSESTDHAVVTANHAIHISGHLSDENGNPITNASISVRPRFSNGKLGHAATGVTNSGGAYSVTFVPRFNAKYIATYAGSPSNDGATANTARTNVRAAVTLSGKSRQSSAATVTGHVAPNKSGKTVTIFKKVSGHWVVAGRARLNGKSAFTTHLALSPGKNRLYATIGNTSGNLAGKSNVLVITVS